MKQEKCWMVMQEESRTKLEEFQQVKQEKCWMGMQEDSRTKLEERYSKGQSADKKNPCLSQKADR